MTQSLFERSGGFASVNRVVIAFYERMLSSPVTSPHFTNTDMKQLIDHQTQFIAFLMGGPVSFTDEYIKRVHERLGFDRPTFDETVNLLTETLEDFDFSDADIATVGKALEARSNLIITVS